MDLVKTLNPDIGRLPNPTWRNKIHPAPCSLGMSSFSISKPNHDKEVKEESDVKFGSTCDLPVGNFSIKTVPRRRMPDFTAQEIKFKLQHQGKTESLNSEQTSTDKTGKVADSNLSNPERKPFNLKPISRSEKGKKKKSSLQQGLSAERYNEQKQMRVKNA